MKRTSSHRPARGFTLIEVIITVAIVGILAAVAVPSYTKSVQKTQRSVAKGIVMEQAQLLERFATASDKGTFAGGPKGSLVSPKGATGDAIRYNIATAIPDDGSTYKVTATPTTQQASDECGALAMDHTGKQTAAKDGCW
ncbi:type IV pilin protein [Massilia atriviolacea]|uniref:Type IV pilin protein n=1 Tax=Massilia atriviolacea TaxID=2495579 RepID=A0A430HS25_9BURK|nr:type IV pilin protein [Massilia atriviolacea]RSZ60297.1 type IV pilin protein [Massilia atriviolacea]